MLKKNILRTNIINDFSLKLFANAIQVIMKNLLILPFLASIMSIVDYGNFITIISVVALICSIFGNSLISTRLILEELYIRSGLEGDFNILAIVAGIIGFAFVYIISTLILKLNNSNVVYISIITMLETMLAYHSGWFILKNEYKKLIIYTIINSFGCFVGLLVTKYTSIWQFTYLISDCISFLYLVKFSPLIKENYSCTINLRSTLLKYFLLIITTGIATSLMYLDKFILFPLLGVKAVAVYTTAGVLGKGYSLISTPMASIILGYFASGKIKMSIQKFLNMNIIIFFTLFAFVFFIFFAATWITGFLYPSLISLAKPYMMIANLSSAIIASSQLLKSVALKYVDTYFILLIQMVYAILYGILSFYFSNKFQLSGFAYATLISSVFHYIALFIICIIYLKKEKV